MSQLTEREQGGNTDEGKSGLGEDRLVDIVDDPALKVQSCSIPVLPRTEACTPDPKKSNPPNLSEEKLEEKIYRITEEIINAKENFANNKALNANEQKRISDLEEKLNEVNANQQKRITQLEEKLNEVKENEQKRISDLEEKLNEVNANQQKRISELEEKLREGERNLWLYGLPEQEAENLKARVIAICINAVPWAAREFHHHIDIVQRIGKRSEVKPRPVIIRFIARSTLQLLWETYKRPEHHLFWNLWFGKELTAKQKDTRKRLWPIIEAARKEGKTAFFAGAKAIVDGKEIRE